MDRGHLWGLLGRCALGVRRTSQRHVEPAEVSRDRQVTGLLSRRKEKDCFPSSWDKSRPGPQLGSLQGVTRHPECPSRWHQDYIHDLAEVKHWLQGRVRWRPEQKEAWGRNDSHLGLAQLGV